MRARTPATAYQPSFEALGQTLFDTTFVVVDLETTGVRPDTDRITEIGAVKVHRGELLGEFQSLVHPGRPIPTAIMTLTGINDAMVAGAPPIQALLPAWLEFARDAVLVAHNARFDISFLTAELARHGYARPDNVVLDTARLARRAFRDEVRDHRLSTLARHVRSQTNPDHRALHDARATVDVLHAILERVGSLGVVTLEDLRDYSRSSSDPLYRRIDMVKAAPSACGVYEFLDEQDEVLYVGKATDLRSRLRTYFGQDSRRRIADMVRLATRVRWTVTPTVLEAEVLELRAIHANAPRFNRRSRRPEKAVYVRLTDERFPRLSIVKKAPDTAEILAPGLFVGPIGSRRVATAFVEAVVEALPIRTCTMRIRVAADHSPCMLKELGKCGAPCDGTQDEAAYAEIINAYRDACAGDAHVLLAPLRDRMLALAADGRFEDAAKARQRLHLIGGVLIRARRLARMVNVAMMIAARMTAAGWEVALLRHGQLMATGVYAELPTIEQLQLALGGGPAASPGWPDGSRAEQLELVLRWLDKPGVRVLHCEGTLAEQIAGGYLLASTRREQRRIDRTVRQDLQTLRGAKVVRRGAITTVDGSVGPVADAS